jgi:hypothetical protein
MQVLPTLTCHFKQLGLKEGESIRSPDAVVKMWSECSVFCRRDRSGSSLAGYIMRGTFSNSCLIGSGAVKIEAGLFKDDFDAGRGVERDWLASVVLAGTSGICVDMSKRVR